MNFYILQYVYLVYLNSHSIVKDEISLNLRITIFNCAKFQRTHINLQDMPLKIGSGNIILLKSSTIASNYISVVA